MISIPVKGEFPPLPVRQVLNANPQALLCGGAIRDYLTHKPINDFDLYVPEGSEFSTDKTWGEPMIKGNNRKIEHKCLPLNLDIILEKYNSETIGGYERGVNIVHTFDFTCCSWFYLDDKFHTISKQHKKDTFEFILAPQNTTYSHMQQLLLRMQKFIDRGYRLTNESAMEFARDLDLMGTPMENPVFAPY